MRAHAETIIESATVVSLYSPANVLTFCDREMTKKIISFLYKIAHINKVVQMMVGKHSGSLKYREYI